MAFAAQGKHHSERARLRAGGPGMSDDECVYPFSERGRFGPSAALHSVLDCWVLVACWSVSAVSVGRGFRPRGAEGPDAPRQRRADTTDHMLIDASF